MPAVSGDVPLLSPIDPMPNASSPLSPTAIPAKLPRRRLGRRMMHRRTYAHINARTLRTRNHSHIFHEIATEIATEVTAA
jgi:hypothetical protein